MDATSPRTLWRGDKWGAPAERRLLFLWESGWALEAIARRMRRTPLACYRKARALGLQTGCPDGYEYITAGAARTGFAEKTFRRVLAFGQVRVHIALADPAQVTKGCFSQRYVSPESVDEAVRKWVASEPVQVAARRHDLGGDTLRRWLREAGVIGEAQTAHRFNQRVASEVIDRVVVERRARPLEQIIDAKRRAAFVRWHGPDAVPEQRACL